MTVKPGTRALGLAESADSPSGDGDGDGDGAGGSVICGAVVRADRVLDDCSFTTCTVGGTDVTAAMERLVSSLDRPDVRYLLVSGVAPAWFNVVDLRRLAAAADRPVVSVSFESSDGLEPALREQFTGEALRRRLETYRRLPPRRRLAVNDETVFVRAVGCDDVDADSVVRAFTPEGGRPEPLRVARTLARGAREWRTRERAERDERAEGDERGGHGERE